MKIEIKHGTILTLNNKNEIIEDGVLCIDNEKIVSTGRECMVGFIPDKVIDAKGGIIMPGLVNAHCHSPMTMFRNFAGGLPLQTWMFKKIRPLQQYVTQKDIESCAKLAYIEMIKSGTAAFAEMYAWADTLGELTAESGLKALIAGNYGKDQGLAGVIDKKRILEHSEEIEEKSNGKVKEGLLLHSLYAVPEKTICETAEFALEAGLRIQIHVSETKTEIEECQEKYHMTPIKKLDELGVFRVPAIAAHGVYLEEADIEVLKQRNVSVAHCPVSNLKLGSGIADIYKLMNSGVNVCLGTDGAASNNNLNLFKEANIAALIAKGIHCDPTIVSAEEILRIAIENGYKALGIEKSGRIEAGMNADIIILSAKEPHFTPLTEVYDAVVYAGQAGDVVMTMVNGEILMEDRVIKTLDEEKILADAKETAKRILKRAE
ncbi:N-ethylammeline chlorohydrolase [Clostridium sp. chh4-2]|uniref:amidohydrolase family protein n=1 Tax=Clostridium sp. chh4-2 TaxID=2067550 RepID=UPI000CCEE550|nr:amidohydrolase [Clostridium sp. chh4-2]PNV60412.1 N-ethylammeline chlorohydrolase [Clostridium sp. chh4-2]